MAKNVYTKQTRWLHAISIMTSFSSYINNKHMLRGLIGYTKAKKSIAQQ